VTREEIIARLVDGRVISVSLAWSWRLSDATAAQRAHFRLIGSGQGVCWPDVDEDISAEGMLYGTPAPRPPAPEHVQTTARVHAGQPAAIGGQRAPRRWEPGAHHAEGSRPSPVTRAALAPLTHGITHVTLRV